MNPLLSHDKRSLILEGQVYPAHWLRDNSRAVKDAGNGQRLYDGMQAPDDLAIASLETNGDGLRLAFSDDGP